MFLFCSAGFLQAEHPAEDPVQAVHEEPTMFDTADQQEQVSVLQAEEVHRRGDEQRW